MTFLGKVAGGKYPYPKPMGKSEDETVTKYEAVEKELPADLKNAITDVVSWMTKMAKGPGAPTEAIGRVATFLGKVAGGKYPYPKPAGKQKPKDEYPYPKTKSDEDDLVVIKSDGTTIVNPNVTKGRKVFTEERTAAIKDAMIQLASTLGEVDGEALKAVVAAIKELPAGKVPDSMVRPVPASVQKTETEKALEEKLDKALKRLDEIEKTRAPSKGGEPDATDKPVQKQEAGFWGGQIVGKK